MIQGGSCTDLNPAPRTVLNPVVDGKSTTTTTAPALTPGDYAIVVHKGVGTGMDTIVACGNMHIS